jgi:hypothetical protein
MEKRSRSKSPRRSRSTSPKSYIQKAKDPLAKIMTRYLEAKDLDSLSKASKDFRNIATPQLRNKKAEIYRLAQNETKRFLPIADYDELAEIQKISSKMNASQQIKLYEFVYSNNPAMQSVINRMKQLYYKITGENYDDDI